MKWACISRFYDNGRTTISTTEVKDDFKEYQKEGKSFDEYCDIFDTMEEAIEFSKQEA